MSVFYWGGGKESLIAEFLSIGDPPPPFISWRGQIDSQKKKIYFSNLLTKQNLKKKKKKKKKKKRLEDIK
jgi:hypothetical protein